MKNKIIVFTAFFFLSCTQGNRTEQDDKSSVQDTVSIQVDSNQSQIQKVDSSIKKDSAKYDEKEIEELPEFEDYESEYQFRYEFYIDKAYNESTYKKYYQPNTYQSKHLDSLIDVYEKKKSAKKASDSINDEP